MSSRAVALHTRLCQVHLSHTSQHACMLPALHVRRTALVQDGLQGGAPGLRMRLPRDLRSPRSTCAGLRLSRGFCWKPRMKAAHVLCFIYTPIGKHAGCGSCLQQLYELRQTGQGAAAAAQAVGRCDPQGRTPKQQQQQQQQQQALLRGQEERGEGGAAVVCTAGDSATVSQTQARTSSLHMRWRMHTLMHSPIVLCKYTWWGHCRIGAAICVVCSKWHMFR